MKELMLVFASVLPEDQIIDEIENGIHEYRFGDKEKGKTSIEMFGMLLASKKIINEDKGGLTSVLDKFDRNEKAFKLLNPED